MKIKSISNKSERGDTTTELVGFGLIVGIVILLIVLASIAGRQEGEVSVQKEAVANGHGNYTVNPTTLKVEFHWNTVTNK